MEVNLHEAKTQLSKLLRRVSAGEQIIISRNGNPIAKLVPFVTEARIFGSDEGVFEVPSDFDAPLPEALLEEFEG